MKLCLKIVQRIYNAWRHYENFHARAMEQCCIARARKKLWCPFSFNKNSKKTNKCEMKETIYKQLDKNIISIVIL